MPKNSKVIGIWFPICKLELRGSDEDTSGGMKRLNKGRSGACISRDFDSAKVPVNVSSNFPLINDK